MQRGMQIHLTPKKPTDLSRRSFLKGSVVAAVAAGIAGVAPASALAQFGRRSQYHGRPLTAGLGEGGYGELRPARDLRDGAYLLALPEGFHYRTFGYGDELMSDGNLTPPAHDGMAAFALPNGNVLLIRNHEDQQRPKQATVRGNPDTAYDPIGSGTTTSLEVAVGSSGEAELVRDFISLNGTWHNCAGGPMPWGAWLSCEETTEGTKQGWKKDHGFVFEVAVEAEDFPVQAIPLKAMGRFSHEAVAIDPATGIIYQTEDGQRFDLVKQLGSGFYRFIPGHYVCGERPDLTNGKLQMLKVQGTSKYNANSGQEVGQMIPVEWVDIDDPDPEVGTDSRSPAVFLQGLAKGAAIFNKLEGCWYDDDSVFFNSPGGGDAGVGQVWAYRPLDQEHGFLWLIFESPDERVLIDPDNITVSPRGGLLLCEGGDVGKFLRGITPDGRIFNFAEKSLANDWAGATFSPQMQTLFVNIQGDEGFEGPTFPVGRTVAIWGPWERGAL